MTRKPPLNSRMNVEPLEQRADLRPAAMHHDRVHARLLDQHDVAGEGRGKLRVAHGVAAIFHHHRRVVVALHEGQRLGQDLGVGVDGGEVGLALRRDWRGRLYVLRRR